MLQMSIHNNIGETCVYLYYIYLRAVVVIYFYYWTYYEHILVNDNIDHSCMEYNIVFMVI